MSKHIGIYGHKSIKMVLCDTNILRRRFIEREKTPERGQANTMGFEPSGEDFGRWCHNLDTFDIGGKTIMIDTTDFNSIDFNKYLENALLFINELAN